LGSSSLLFTELDLGSNHTLGDGLGLGSGVDGWMFSMVILGLGISMLRLLILVRVRSLYSYLGGFFVINPNSGRSRIPFDAYTPTRSLGEPRPFHFVLDFLVISISSKWRRFPFHRLLFRLSSFSLRRGYSFF